MASTGRTKKFAFSLLIVITIVFAFLFASCGKEHHHEWGEWEPYIESTCYVAGQERALCSCGAAKYRRVELAHEFVSGKIDISEKTMAMVCSKCGAEEEHELTSEAARIPLVTIDGGTLSISWGGNSYTAVSESYGADSLKFTLDGGAASLSDGAGAYSVYVLSPGYLALEGSRGAIAEDLYGKVVRSRNLADAVSSSVNGGAGAGYPAAVYNGKEYRGIYTLSPVKGAATLGMAEGGAAFLAAGTTEQTELRAVIATTAEESGFRVLYASDGLGNDAVVQSFNNMIAFITENDWGDFADGIGPLLNVDRAIDGMLFTCAAGDAGCVCANILWATYDGTTWVPVPYQLDGAFAKGTVIEPDHGCNLLWEKLWMYFDPETRARWRDLRFGVLSLDSIKQTAADHFDRIPAELLERDEKLAAKVAESKEAAVAAVMESVNGILAQLDVYYGLQ